MTEGIHLILSKDCEASGRQRLFESAVAAWALQQPIDSLWVVPETLHLAHGDPLWARWRNLDGRLFVFTWQNPRPIRWLFAGHGIALGEDGVIDLRTVERPGDLAGHIPASGDASRSPERHDADGTPGERWYPVVDFDRCSHCMQCLQYCLFGVYEDTGDGRLRVANPDRCKPGCPACSRICPEGAIMFPLYSDPAVAGAEGCAMPDPTPLEHEPRRANVQTAPSESPDGKPETADLDALIDDLENLL